MRNITNFFGFLSKNFRVETESKTKPKKNFESKPNRNRNRFETKFFFHYFAIIMRNITIFFGFLSKNFRVETELKLKPKKEIRNFET